jgi:hypothetical protein
MRDLWFPCEARPLGSQEGNLVSFPDSWGWPSQGCCYVQKDPLTHRLHRPQFQNTSTNDSRKCSFTTCTSAFPLWCHQTGVLLRGLRPDRGCSAVLRKKPCKRIDRVDRAHWTKDSKHRDTEPQAPQRLSRVPISSCSRWTRPRRITCVRAGLPQLECLGKCAGGWTSRRFLNPDCSVRL